MRESNFAFPAQNRACVCITSQLYDRRALDTNSPLPLFNSLTHLTYLTSTSPRIREIMTMDGGLERLVRILHDFCMCPPPQENSTMLYGLSSPSSQPPKPVPTLNPKSFDKYAAYRFSLAFQCVVNIGVRGSESIRSRVVQAGTLDVVGCILEAWLANKGFAVGPSVSASGMPRETREQRLARRAAQNEARQREHAAQQAAHLARALQRQVVAERYRTDRVVAINQEDEPMEAEATRLAAPTGARDGDTSAETSSNATPLGSNTPTGAVVVPSRDRSGTVIARPVWDQPPVPTASTSHHRRTHRNVPTRLSVPPSTSEGPSTSNSTDTSRPETETEDDGDVDMEDSMRESDAPSVSGASTPERRNPSPETTGTIRAAPTHSRRAVGIVSDTADGTGPGASIDLIADARVIINDQAVGVQGVGGVEDGFVSFETNDDLAMGAPPGAPGAIDGTTAIPDPHAPAGEQTPRAGPVGLPGVIPVAVPPIPATTVRVTNVDGLTATPATAPRMTTRGVNTTATMAGANGANGRHHHHHHNHDMESGPYRDEDVLLSLQLLAYLSKYPHVRQAFYKPRTTFHPASVNQQPSEVKYAGPSRVLATTASTSSPSSSTITQTTTKESNNPFLKAFATATGRGKEKEKATAIPSSASTSTTPGSGTPRMTNVFSLVERFTFRPSSSELDSPNPPPTLPPDIQYWAGVIMRNACRKDDSRGGIRQCANMMCGKWESFPREFAKCRRCRKAKYCGKECQSTAWSEGHRFWCSAKDPEEDGDHHNGDGTRARANTLNASTSTANGPAAGPAPPATGTPATGRAERRVERTESDNRQRRAVAAAQILAMGGPGNAVRTAASPIGNVTMNPNTAPTNLAPTPNGNPVILPGPSVGNGPVTWQWSASILNMRRPRGRTDDVNAANLPGEPSDPMRVVVDQQPAGAPRPLPARRMAVLGEPRRPGMPPWGREEIVEDGDEDDSMIIG